MNSNQENRKSNVFRKPWPWLITIAIGGIQIFTVNTSRIEPLAQRTPTRVRVPASAGDDSKVESKPEAKAETSAAGDEDRLILMSWNVRALFRQGADYDRAALVLGDADVAVVNDMDLTGTGKGFLNVLGGLIDSRTGEKFCRAWTQGADGGRLHYGYIWRESKVAYIAPNGEMQDECSTSPVTIRQDAHSRYGVHATFFSKTSKRLFELAVATFERRPTNGTEVDEVFRMVSEKQWPVVVIGDFKADAKPAGYLVALDPRKRTGQHSFENFWYRNVAMASSGTIDLYQRFGDSRREDIEKGLSDVFPIAVEMHVNGEVTEEMSSAVIRRADRGGEREKSVEKSFPEKINLKHRAAKKRSVKKVSKVARGKAEKAKPKSTERARKPATKVGQKVRPAPAPTEETLEDEAKNADNFSSGGD